ncbi:Stk1 family PASTA domain-containing Ser/Thr kinase [Pontimonas sp.]|uniref:Stk1 family PASTA domain-containing Ser/Thr kinase n=1 Tax=Pontimonas sp. TaxID=2304492 RepID=UPI00286FEE6F|nr:Stk1 family PASTA domain-containing Ser/Thr kinase [Pontimonas sp.]MDR9396344.1 Stk1 family PASTA domain-containing Ser/Thr kinase [Pontimonas sp.]
MNNAAADPLVGTTIDKRYLIEDRVARGGMASVYRGLDYRLERPVAVKVMHPHLAEDAQFTARFIQEARQAARLSHPNIVNVFDQGQDGDLTFIVMEYLPGITLRELLNDFGVLTWEQTLDVVKAILQGLDLAHQAGIVHRDLKPENILMADDGRIKIADFGLARAASHNTQTGQALLGTVAYLSPELVTGSSADVRSDLYALGIMMFEMLTGKQPFTGDQAVTIAYQHANASVPLPSHINPDVPDELDEIIRWSTLREPEDRPAHARALLDQIIRVEQDIKKRVAAGEPTRVMPAASDEADGTQILTRANEPRPHPGDDEPTEVLGRAGDVFAGLEVPDYAEASSTDTPAQAASKPRRGPGAGVWWAFILSALATIGLAVWLFAPQGPTVVTVPSMTGSTVQEAGDALQALGLVVSEELDQAFDDTVPAGLVITTDPESGVDVEEETMVTLIISQGVEPTALPPLLGLPLEESETRLTEARLTLGTVERKYSDTAPSGVITEVTNDAGVTIAPGTELDAEAVVNLVTSAGSLPDVEGLSVEQAQEALQEVELQGVVGGDGEFSETIDEGLVIQYSPSTHDAVEPGDTVTLTISRGPPLVTIPDLVGETIQDAVDALEDLGLEADVRTVLPEDSWSDSRAEVTSVEPAEGQQVPIGTTVAIRSFA